MTRLWLVRLGRNGETEQLALDESTLRLGWDNLGDVTALKDREAILGRLKDVIPDGSLARQRNYAAQINQFVNVAQTGDLVVCPMRLTSTIAVGKLAGPYAPGPNGELQRPVAWLKTGLPRGVFKQDLLYSFGAFMTVCEVARNDALGRVEAVVQTGSDPGWGGATIPNGALPSPNGEVPTGPAEPSVDLAELARDQIEKRIASSFAGHDLARLVGAVLEAQGYRVRVSPPGPDGGVDILAGKGSLGTESPRLVVQVKSGSFDHPTLQALIGGLHESKADYGLAVSWVGFTAPVSKKQGELYFKVQLWDRKTLVDNVLATYERLSDEIRAALPLRRVWTLIPDDSE